MDQQLQAALAAILNKTMGAVESGVSFLQAELPDVIQQLLLWKLVWAAIVFAIATAIFLVWLVVGIRTTLKFERRAKSYEEGHGWVTFGVIGIFIGMPSFATAMCGLYEILQIALAPKIYLIEYAASLAK